MTDFILKKYFLADGANRETCGVASSIVGILCNLLLFAFKLFAGIITNSIAIIADSINNLSDSGSSIVALLGFRLGSSPADAEHPFGHGRMEYISALIVSFIILLLGYEFFKTSITKILNPEETLLSPVMLVILIAAIITKLWLSLFYRKIGKTINSGIFTASSVDSRNDIIVTSITLLSILFTRFTGILIDGWAGLAVSAFILYSGFIIAKETLQPLLGEAVSRELADKITKAVLGYEGIIGVHDLIVHNYGPSMSIATIHAEIPADSPLHDAHELVDRIETELSKKLDIALTIHMDPVNLNDARLQPIKEAMRAVTSGYDGVSAHDLRIIDQTNVVNLVFELTVPHNSDEDFKKKIISAVSSEIKKLDERYVCLITIEHGFVDVEND